MYCRVLIAVLMLFSATTKSEQDILFRISELSLPERVDAAVLPAFIMNEKQAHLIIRQIDEQEDKRSLTLFSFSGNGIYQQSNFETILIPDDVIFIDIGKVQASSLDNIILFRRNSIWIYDPVNRREYHILDMQSIYKNPILEELPHFDVVKDINGDSLDDILLPGFDGYQLFIQTSPGVFAEPIMIDILPIMASTEDFNYSAVVYEINESYLADANFDQKNDLFFWDPPELKAYLQNDMNGYFTDHIKIPVGVKLESTDDLAKRMSREDQSQIKARTFHKIVDINADDWPDLVTQTIVSKGVFNKTTTFEFFMGQRNDENSLRFSKQADTKISSKGFQIDPEEKDFNNDGKTDYVVTSIDIGIGMLIKALFTGSVTIDLNFYQQGDHGFSDAPNMTRELKIKFSFSSGDFSAPLILIVDVNGDKIMDLLTSDKNTLKVSYGDGSKRLFSRKQYELAIDIPNDPTMVDHYDLNKDGKMDIILRYDDDERNLQNEIKVLIAR